MKTTVCFSLALGLLASCLGSVAQAEDAAPTVTATAIAGPLYLLQGRGGNVVASVGEDGILLVDDDYPQYAEAYREALADLDEGGRQPRFVLNTHWHGDHTGGNEFWASRGAVLVAHTNVRKRMGSRQDMKALGRVVEASPPQALPVVTFGDSLALHFNGEDVEVQHYPSGHTDGDSVVFFAGHNVVHLGDHFFKDRFPFVDIGSGGNVLGFTTNIEQLLARVDDKTVIVPGHGSIANKADLLRYHGMLTSTTKMVRQGLADGLSVEALIERGLGKDWESWGGGFINEEAWIRFIAGSL